MSSLEYNSNIGKYMNRYPTHQKFTPKSKPTKEQPTT